MSWFSLSSPAPLGIDALAHPWPDRRLYAFLPVSLLFCLLVAPFCPSQMLFSELIPLFLSAPQGDSNQTGHALSASGQDLAPSTRDLEAVGMAHPRPQVLISSLPAEVQETSANARAPATRKLYSSKWRVFESWCLPHAVDPVICPIGPVLEFLQERLPAKRQGWLLPP